MRKNRDGSSYPNIQISTATKYPSLHSVKFCIIISHSRRFPFLVCIDRLPTVVCSSPSHPQSHGPHHEPMHPDFWLFLHPSVRNNNDRVVTPFPPTALSDILRAVIPHMRRYNLITRRPCRLCTTPPTQPQR